MLIPLLVAIISLGLVFLALYLDWFAPVGVGAKVFCEASRDALIRQPANTWSNVGFIIAGLASGWLQMKDVFKHNNNSLTRNAFFGIFFSSVVVCLGPGSMAMHASESSLGGYFDMLSMYFIAALMFSYAVRRLFRLNALGFTLTFVLVLAICHIANFLEHTDLFWGNVAFGFFIVSSMVMEYLIHRSGRSQIEFKWALACMFSFVLAFLIWLTGLTDSPWCDPHSLLQGHAIWHLLCALAVFFLFRYYISENETRVS